VLGTVALEQGEDEDSIGIRPNDHPIVQEGVAVAPVLGLLDWMKSRHD
jgi:hypothetical protein